MPPSNSALLSRFSFLDSLYCQPAAARHGRSPQSINMRSGHHVSRVPSDPPTHYAPKKRLIGLAGTIIAVTVLL
jgi:hypothetical protein